MVCAGPQNCQSSPQDYGLELLPQRPRAIVTPNMQRAFIALTQALHSGRLGTVAAAELGQQSETIQELGHLLGRWVVPFPASGAHCVTRPLLGCAAVGAWGVIEDLHRLPVQEAKGVCDVLGALAGAWASNSDSLALAGVGRVRLRPGFGVLATVQHPPPLLLSGPAPLTPLPPALREVLLWTCLPAPQLEPAVRVKLAACGFQAADSLAAKICLLVDLCRVQLSPQRHYTWSFAMLGRVLEQVGRSLAVLALDNTPVALSAPDVPLVCGRSWVSLRSSPIQCATQ